MTYNDKIEYFFPDRFEEIKRQIEIEEIGREGVFNGTKVGMSMAYVILFLGIGILVASLIRFYFNIRYSRVFSTIYCLLLSTISICELWYLFSLGIEDMSWFIIKKEIGNMIASGTALVAIGFIQFNAMARSIRDLGDYHFVKINFKYTLYGVAISGIISLLAYVFELFPHYEITTFLIIVVCQIPQLIYIWRRVPEDYDGTTNSKTLITLYSALIIIGSVTLLVYATYILIIALLYIFAAFAFTGFGAKSSSTTANEAAMNDLNEASADASAAQQRGDISVNTEAAIQRRIESEQSKYR